MTNPKEPYGSVTYADPGYQADKKKRYPLDTEAHCRAAWSYINQADNAKMYSADELASIKAKISAALKKYGANVSSSNSGSAMSSGYHRSAEAQPIETRTATIDNVDFGQRIVSLIAVPYEEPAEIVYRQEMWKEVFSRTAFNGIETRQSRIPANREHNPNQLIGKVIQTYPARDEGLVVDIKVSRTVLGDETLALADDQVLSASAGFQVKNPYQDQILDRNSKTRRITRAFLDHVALVQSPAYAGAKVLATRNPETVDEASLEPLNRPRLDEWMNDPAFQWMSTRLAK